MLEVITIQILVAMEIKIKEEVLAVMRMMTAPMVKGEVIMMKGLEKLPGVSTLEERLSS